MSKRILITGSTDGIGELTAKKLAASGHEVILHGRNPSKLERVAAEIGGDVSTVQADFSRIDEVEAMAQQILERYDGLDVVINNAGVLKTSSPTTAEGLDVRFVVNTIAPAVLTRRLLPIIPKSGRVVNLSSAAQARVDVNAMKGGGELDASSAYAQSKLAITIWTREFANELGGQPLIVAVNPGSLLASKMVKEGYGIAGNDLNIGADILCEAAVGDSFANASGAYYDNDSKGFATPNAAALDETHAAEVMKAIEEVAARLSGTSSSG